MSTPRPARTRRAPAALAVAACLALGAASCTANSPQQNSSRASQPDTANPSASTPQTQKNQNRQHGRQAQPRPLAQIKGPGSLKLTITAAERLNQFLTLRGELTNDGADTSVVPAALRGTETAIVKNGQSLGGATLVDFKGRKRYYVLRDTDGRPLTTTGLDSLKPKENVRIFMQFPAPPAATIDVDFQLPQFDTATLRISG